MRSKSEAMIAMNLYVQKIPYRYECELKLGSITLFPDFTIRHPETGEIFYWEHFGMMDKSEYVKNASDKISMGFIQMINCLCPMKRKSSHFPLSRSSDYYNFISTASFNNKLFLKVLSHWGISIATENR